MGWLKGLLQTNFEYSHAENQFTTYFQLGLK